MGKTELRELLEDYPALAEYIRGSEKSPGIIELLESLREDEASRDKLRNDLAAREDARDKEIASLKSILESLTATLNGDVVGNLTGLQKSIEGLPKPSDLEQFSVGINAHTDAGLKEIAGTLEKRFQSSDQKVGELITKFSDLKVALSERLQGIDEKLVGLDAGQQAQAMQIRKVRRNVLRIEAKINTIVADLTTISDVAVDLKNVGRRMASLFTRVSRVSRRYVELVREARDDMAVGTKSMTDNVERSATLLNNLELSDQKTNQKLARLETFVNQTQVSVEDIEKQVERLYTSQYQSFRNFVKDVHSSHETFLSETRDGINESLKANTEASTSLRERLSGDTRDLATGVTSLIDLIEGIKATHTSIETLILDQRLDSQQVKRFTDGMQSLENYTEVATELREILDELIDTLQEEQ